MEPWNKSLNFSFPTKYVNNHHAIFQPPPYPPPSHTPSIQVAAHPSLHRRRSNRLASDHGREIFGDEFVGAQKKHGKLTWKMTWKNDMKPLSKVTSFNIRCIVVLVESIKNWMGPNPNGPRSGSCDRAIRFSGLGVRNPWVLLEISWIPMGSMYGIYLSIHNGWLM